MILGFRSRFPWGEPTYFREKLIAGTKIHTVRRDEKNRWHENRLIEMAYGVRTKKYEQFAYSRCSSVSPIIIDPNRERVFIDDRLGRVFRYEGVLEFAQNDGFDSLDDFWRWFDSYFEGRLIFFGQVVPCQ